MRPNRPDVPRRGQRVCNRTSRWWRGCRCRYRSIRDVSLAAAGAAGGGSGAADTIVTGLGPGIRSRCVSEVPSDRPPGRAGAARIRRPAVREAASPDPGTTGPAQFSPGDVRRARALPRPERPERPERPIGRPSVLGGGAIPDSLPGDWIEASEPQDGEVRRRSPPIPGAQTRASHTTDPDVDVSHGGSRRDRGKSGPSRNRSVRGSAMCLPSFFPVDELDLSSEQPTNGRIPGSASRPRRGWTFLDRTVREDGSVEFAFRRTVENGAVRRGDVTLRGAGRLATGIATVPPRTTHRDRRDAFGLRKATTEVPLWKTRVALPAEDGAGSWPGLRCTGGAGSGGLHAERGAGTTACLR